MAMGRATPFLKWAGGKRWLFEHSRAVMPAACSRLVEPFAGGAAAFFRLVPERAWLNDINEDLIDTYRAIATDWEEVVRILASYHLEHSPTLYYKVRQSTPHLLSARAARFIYLNRTCFNGLYRVNLKGVFNVPVGTKASILMPDDDFELTSRRLERVKLSCDDFQAVIDKTGSTDFIFADPPYTVNHNLNGFIKYNEKLFSWDDQVRLRDALFRASRRGATVLVSNADHESIRLLYKDSQSMSVLGRHSIMAANASQRRATTELLIRV
jgi:DNA adenine methylase